MTEKSFLKSRAFWTCAAILAAALATRLILFLGIYYHDAMMVYTNDALAIARGEYVPGGTHSFRYGVLAPTALSILLFGYNDFACVFYQLICSLLTVGAGAHAAVLSGFRAGSAPAVVVLPADDTYNAGIIDRMFRLFREGNDIVAASRFMPGGRMEGCPWLKSALVRAAAATLRRLARLPVHDATNGFRLFSRRAIDRFRMESSRGFTFSIELLVKSRRAELKIAEVPALWLERTRGRSRFRVFSWLPAYLRWYVYAFATAYLGRRKPD